MSVFIGDNSVSGGIGRKEGGKTLEGSICMAGEAYDVLLQGTTL